MGTTTSRPIIYNIESFLLQTADVIDTIVRLAHRLVSSFCSSCIPSSWGLRDYRFRDGKKFRACDVNGVCYLPATKVKERQKLKRQKEDRLRRRKLRAEWAAAGLDVLEMEKQEMMKRHGGDQRKVSLDRITSSDSALVATSPALRSTSPRIDEVSEKQAINNIGASRILPIQTTKAVSLPPLFPSAYKGPRKPLEAVREVSQHEKNEFALQGHGRRIASGASEHGDISYQVVAASPAKEAFSEQMSPARLTKAHRSITAQGLMPIMTSTSSARISRPIHKGHTASLPDEPSVHAPLPLVRPTAHRPHDPRKLSVTIPPKEALHSRKDSSDLRSDSPRFFNCARASLDLATAASQLSRPCSPYYSSAGLISSASSDACSITSKRSFFGGIGGASGSNSISRASTPPCISDLADRACKSRWEANASERKIWKEEVDRITLQRLNQASKRKRQDGQAALRIYQDSNDCEFMKRSMSGDSQMKNLAALAEKRLRRASVEPKSATIKSAKLKRRSSQKA